MILEESVQTKEFSLDRKSYLNILLIHKMTRALIPVAIMWILIVWNYMNDNGVLATIFLFMSFIYLLYIYLVTRQIALGKSNKAMFSPQRFVFMKDHLLQINSKGKVEIPYEMITKVARRKDHVKLHLKKGTWLYIPNAAFESRADLSRAIRFV